jgi:hypothetical protein
MTNECKLCNTNHETRLKFVNWHLYGLNEGEAYRTFILVGSTTRFELRGYVKSQNNMFFVLIHEVPFQDVAGLCVVCHGCT